VAEVPPSTAKTADPNCDGRSLDPRIRRTRQMLRDAFFSLLQEKSFEDISIQDIAERSTVNRATFYDHYSDKPALVEDVIVERFDGLLCQRQVCFDGTCVSAIRPLILATCDFLGQLNQGQCTKHERLFEPFVQTAIQKRLQQVLLEGLKKNASKKGVDPHVIAAAASWAIYGAVVQWVHAENRAPAESFADIALQLVGPMLHLPAGGRHAPAARETGPARAKGRRGN
jgi:AcrR family transcriptional regulator